MAGCAVLVKDPRDFPIPCDCIPDVVCLVCHTGDEYEKCNCDGALHKIVCSITADGTEESSGGCSARGSLDKLNAGVIALLSQEGSTTEGRARGGSHHETLRLWNHPPARFRLRLNRAALLTQEGNLRLQFQTAPIPKGPDV